MDSLRAKLLAPFIAGMLALTLLLAWYTYDSARKAVEGATLLISADKTNHTAQSMAQFFRSTGSSLQQMVSDPHVTALFGAGGKGGSAETGKASTSDWLEIVQQGNEFYRDLLIVDKHGVCIAASNPGLIGNSYAEENYVRQALDGVFSFGEPSVGRVTKRLSTVSAGPVDTAEGVSGALILMSDLPRIVEYGSKNAYDSQIIFTALLDGDGVFMAHKDGTLMGNAGRAFPKLYEKLARVGEKGGEVRYELEGRTYVGYAKLENTSNWVVLTSGLESEVFAPATRLGLTVLGISFTFLTVIGFAVIRFANGILSTLLSLIGYAKRVSEGDLASTLAPTDRKDELGVLHASLRRLVASLQSMLEATREASKMKSQFLANMSHEIRTPLNAIIGMAYLSLRDNSLSDKQRGNLDKIQLAARSLLGLINDILDLSKVEAGMLEVECTPFSLKEVLGNSLAIHQDNAASKGLELRLEYAQDLPARFCGDALRMGQVVNNLVSNAIKFTEKGRITLRCGWDEAAAQGVAAVVRISVSDTGIGISPEALKNLFQPFTQADASITRQFGGTGLGLAISDKLVTLMGGTFSVSSEMDKGTTFAFSVRFCRADQGGEQSGAEEAGELSFDQLDLSGRRILVAEDNDINQLIMQELLAPTGAAVTLAGNGEEAVARMREGGFDLVFMDMQMPVMDGLEATRRIRDMEGAKDVPIIAFTANAMKEDKDKGFAVGMNDYLTKPIEPDQLLQMLRLWLNAGKKPGGNTGGTPPEKPPCACCSG